MRNVHWVKRKKQWSCWQLCGYKLQYGKLRGLKHTAVSFYKLFAEFQGL